jgi:hypothetical protein
MNIKDFGFALIGFLASRTNYKKQSEWIAIQLAEYERRKASQQKNFKARGECLKLIENYETKKQEKCSHQKGGEGPKKSTGWDSGRGDSQDYAVIKHRYSNGDIHVHCLRCGKRWTPGIEGYKDALNFYTRNVTSTDILKVSIQNGEYTDNFAEAFRQWTNTPQVGGLNFDPKAEAAKKRVETFRVKKPE